MLLNMSLEDRILDGGANHSKSSAMWSTEGEKEIISRKIEDLSLSSALQAESDSLSYSNSRFEKGEAKGALYQPLRSRPLLFDPLSERHSGPLSGPRGVMAEARFDEFNKQKEAGGGPPPRACCSFAAAAGAVVHLQRLLVHLGRR